MIAIDTSVWIDYFAGKETWQTDRLRQFIHDQDDLCVCGIIWTEILQGIRNEKEYQSVKTFLGDLLYLQTSKITHIGAADLYRALRKKGITIRKSNDCIIAATCISESIPILHNDQDFSKIAKHSSLEEILK